MGETLAQEIMDITIHEAMKVPDSSVFKGIGLENGDTGDSQLLRESIEKADELTVSHVADEFLRKARASQREIDYAHETKGAKAQLGHYQRYAVYTRIANQLHEDGYLNRNLYPNSEAHMKDLASVQRALHRFETREYWNGMNTEDLYHLYRKLHRQIDRLELKIVAESTRNRT